MAHIGNMRQCLVLAEMPPPDKSSQTRSQTLSPRAFGKCENRPWCATRMPWARQGGPWASADIVRLDRYQKRKSPHAVNVGAFIDMAELSLGGANHFALACTAWRTLPRAWRCNRAGGIGNGEDDDDCAHDRLPKGLGRICAARGYG